MATTLIPASRRLTSVLLAFMLALSPVTAMTASEQPMSFSALPIVADQAVNPPPLLSSLRPNGHLRHRLTQWRNTLNAHTFDLSLRLSRYTEVITFFALQMITGGDSSAWLSASVLVLTSKKQFGKPEGALEDWIWEPVKGKDYALYIVKSPDERQIAAVIAGSDPSETRLYNLAQEKRHEAPFTRWTRANLPSVYHFLVGEIIGEVSVLIQQDLNMIYAGISHQLIRGSLPPLRRFFPEILPGHDQHIAQQARHHTLDRENALLTFLAEYLHTSAAAQFATSIQPGHERLAWNNLLKALAKNLRRFQSISVTADDLEAIAMAHFTDKARANLALTHANTILQQAYVPALDDVRHQVLSATSVDRRIPRAVIRLRSEYLPALHSSFANSAHDVTIDEALVRQQLEKFHVLRGELPKRIREAA